MSQDTNIENLIINKLTKAQYESIETPDPTQLYFITDEVISSADVISALGYTPYNATNPAGYISSAAIASLTDVALTGLADGQILKYNSTTQKWENSAASGGTWGSITGTLSNQTDLQTALNAKQLTLVSGTNIKTINNNSILGSGNIDIDSLPSQTGQSGKFLTTNGTTASWGNMPVATASTVGVVKPDNASIRVSNDGTLSAICRNVGEIISSTLPLTDAGLHLLDGSLLPYGIYKEFIDYIADLYAENPSANYFCTESQWQASVSTYGSCGKFVYDSVNNTVRLPKVSDILQGTTDVTALGDLVEAGLPNITGQLNFAVAYDSCSGAFEGRGGESGSYPLTNRDAQKGYHKIFDASRSSTLYGNSTTVQPQTIKVLYYIVIANSTKTDIQVDIDEIATDLNGKADVDLTNVNDAGNIKMAGASMPSDTYTNLTLDASGTQYTAPADGWFYIDKSGNNGTYVGFVNFGINNTYKYATTIPIYNTNGVALLPVKKNDKITVNYNAAGTTNVFRFIYAQGSESEAS